MTACLNRLWPVAMMTLGLLAAPAFAETHTVPLNQSLQAQESYFGLGAGATKVIGKTASYLSLNGTWIFNEGLSFGLYLDSILSQHVANEETYNLKDVTLWNTGVSLGWQQEVAGPFLVRAQIKAGFGQLNYRDTRLEDAKMGSANLGFVTPELGVLMQVTDDVRFGVTGGYRYTSKPDVVNELNVKAKDISAPVFGLELSLKTD